MGKIILLQSDITQLAVDAIVNAANKSLLGGGGVDGAIHAAAGPELLAACRQLNGCPTGEAKITPGFQLPARYVIHTVGPVWRGGYQDEPALLTACYENSLRLAQQYQLRQVAFPAISTGVYRYPKKEAAQIALTVMRQWQATFDSLIACCFSADDFRYYQQLCPECQQDGRC